MTATKYMRLAANINRDLYLESTSIRAALELLSDKEADEQQVGDEFHPPFQRQARGNVARGG